MSRIARYLILPLALAAGATLTLTAAWPGAQTRAAAAPAAQSVAAATSPPAWSTTRGTTAIPPTYCSTSARPRAWVIRR
jgi:hypothetical protein